MRDGQPLDSAVGLTLSGGIMMGSRTADLDPGERPDLLCETMLDVM